MLIYKLTIKIDRFLKQYLCEIDELAGTHEIVSNGESFSTVSYGN